MVRLGANDSGISSGLLFALLGSVSLHMTALLWTPAPSRAYTSPPIEARLIQAAPVADYATLLPAPRMSQPAQTVPLTVSRPARKLAAPQRSSPMAPVAAETAADAPAELRTPAMAAQPGAANVDGHDPVYYAVEQLDESAHLLGEVQRIYPARARNAGIEGFVTLALLINERGEVDEVHVMKSQPTGYFEESAVAMLRGQRFAPAIKQGVAVKSRWQTTIRFRLRD